jgi:hypothetical protein
MKNRLRELRVAARHCENPSGFRANGAPTQYCTLTLASFFFFFWLGYLIINRRYK